MLEAWWGRSDVTHVVWWQLSRTIRHRGPDGSGIHMVPTKGTEGERISALGHERLAIVGVMDDPAAKEAAGSDASQHAKLHSLSGNQPLYSHDRLALGRRLGGPGSRG